MTLNYVTLVLDAYDAQGNPVTKGSASFVPSAQLTDAGVEWIPQAPIPAVFHAGGLPSVKLLPTDAGFNPTYSGDYFKGLISQVIIYTTALSAARVLTHYQAGAYA